MKNTTLHPTRGRLVCRIFDAGERFVDRYTIAFKGCRIKGYGMNYPYLASGPTPFHPQGFGQHGESRLFLTGRQLGKRVSFESLPPDVQKFIMESI